MQAVAALDEVQRIGGLAGAGRSANEVKGEGMVVFRGLLDSGIIPG